MKKYSVEISLHTDIGDRKPTNQDSIYSRYEEVNGNNIGLFIVADGMGGLSRGEDISSLIVKFFDRWLEDNFISSDNNANIEILLDNAIKTVNKGAKEYSNKIGEKMGSTIALIFIYNNMFYIKNVGDSRIYLVRKAKKYKLTKDHSLVAQMVRNNEITEEEALNHPKKNILTMCIGVEENIDIFSNSGEISKNDIFLLCSDGFYNYSKENEIVPILMNKKINFIDKAKYLRATIPSGNARDNVSIILFTIVVKKNIFGF